MIKAACVFGAGVALSLAAHATDMSVFGVELGKPITLPECPYKQLSDGMKLYDVMPKLTCVHDPHPLQGYGQPPRELSFGRDEVPAIVKNWTAFLLQDENGNVIGFHFLTRGIETQDAVLAQLKAKYGAPSKIEPRSIRTAVGGPFDTFDAQWTLPDLVVEFQATNGRIDRGDVTVDLPAAAALRKQWLLNSKERKL